MNSTKDDDEDNEASDKVGNTRDGTGAKIVQVIIPVHNASETIEAAVRSAMTQEYPSKPTDRDLLFNVICCCYDDGSTDESWNILNELKREFDRKQEQSKADPNSLSIPSSLLIASGGAVSRGAGFSRNRAIQMVESRMGTLLCLLDSDDIMHRHRVVLQARNIGDNVSMLLGCTFQRDPPDATWHYASWANGLTDERVYLEQYREVTILQPTWMLHRQRWEEMGGYIEAPVNDVNNDENIAKSVANPRKSHSLCLVHPEADTNYTLRLAEDLRFFHEHLYQGGDIRLLRSQPLVTYRHKNGATQSAATSRRLLLSLRAYAFERRILLGPWKDRQFVVWGAGRDGKDFVKSLSASLRRRVYCMVDVDVKKIQNIKYYTQKEAQLKIPIVHFSLLAADPDVRCSLGQMWELGPEGKNIEAEGRINKSKPQSVERKEEPKKDFLSLSLEPPATKKRKTHYINNFDASILPTLPVVVCVSMYRTNGALERNVMAIGRKEGDNLWHFS